MKLLPHYVPDGDYVNAEGRLVRPSDVFRQFSPGEIGHLQLVANGEPVRMLGIYDCGCGVCEECLGRMKAKNPRAR